MNPRGSTDKSGRAHPRDHVGEACRVLGTDVVISWLGDLLSGRSAVDDPDQPPIALLGGHTRWKDYWARTWGGRGMLYVWDETLIPDVVTALADEHWRVREMAAKVCRLREIGAAAEALATVVTDPVERPRVAALKALALVGEGEHFEVVLDALDDPSPTVRAAADKALATMRERLDRTP